MIRPQVPVVKNTENHVEILTDFYNHGYEYAQDIFEKAASFAGWEGEKYMDPQKIARINELYRRSKAEGLTDAEKKEQKLLRLEYIEAVRMNLRGQLNNIDIKEKDGSVVNLGEKYDKNGKKGN